VRPIDDDDENVLDLDFTFLHEHRTEIDPELFSDNADLLELRKDLYNDNVQLSRRHYYKLSYR